METCVKTGLAYPAAEDVPRGRDDEGTTLIRCGRVSERTRGMPNLPFFELGDPPYNRIFVGEE